MPLVLHQIDGSPPCRAALMVIEILGLKVDIIEVNTLAGEQHKPEYLKKNQLHTVPLLEDGDFILPDSHAIITYLVSKYGAEKRAQLYPSDLRVRASVDQKMYFETSHVFPKFLDVIRAILKDKAPGPSEKHVAEIEEAYGFLDNYLQTSKYVAADHVTLADISLVATVSTLPIFVPIDAKYSKLLEWLERLQQEEWYKKGNEPGLTRIKGLIQHLTNNP